MAYKAILIGATGLIGSNLLSILLNSSHYDEVVILVRRDSGLQHSKLRQHIVNFDDENSYAAFINGHVVFSCLGTTKKHTPEKKQYYKIDHDYPLQMAQLSKKNGVNQFHVVSSIGANKDSSIFYTKTKGELEDDLKALRLQSLHIYQPSMLIGERKGNRAIENLYGAIFKISDPLLIGKLKKYRSVKGAKVAQAMYIKSLEHATGTFTYTSDQINNI
ncbi:NAD-dependent epimerase/dehydratase family protein [Mucilaginibacter pallidiroseus]|uniref:NAD-dependent epimerase/dehydratase family protein n=1 Tax=Mucilaginibacter pallidiroseus TaxID=2599295 RepID=A0A563UEQ0_9SPHI|nr:NAD(P)H-binding protein [Mucilaginibacter pallidiroseus]TWR29852.1 NAD-dependent epimerase/dehydratase family protein [Mucilaginibacter pallidiroseus]